MKPEIGQRKAAILWAVLLLWSCWSCAGASCLTTDGIADLDAAYEQALTNQSEEFFDRNLHDNFVWIHNHASSVQDSKEAFMQLLRTFNEPGRGHINARRGQSGTQVLIEGNAAVIHGFTDVERTEAYVERTGNPRKIRFHFMRTYVKKEGRCLLLSNHTMEVWREGQPEPSQ